MRDFLIESTISWKWDNCEVTLGVDEGGAGSSLVLLPALSSISTRAEMRPLLDRLTQHFFVSSVDWPGFGRLPRPKNDWSPDALSTFLDWYLTKVSLPPHSIVAVGHAATYLLHYAAHQPCIIHRLVLITPTWRGPLPTVFDGMRPWFTRVTAAIDHHVLGPVLYRLNVSRFVLRKMAREHVYADPNWLSGARLLEKLPVTKAAGARHASVRFVTGALDRVHDRQEFLELARRVTVPTLVVYGGEIPLKSRTEMDSLADLQNVLVKQLSVGKLAIHEEFPEVVSEIVVPFLRE